MSLQPAFLGLSTGRAGSRTLNQLLNAIGIQSEHETTHNPPFWHNRSRGEVTAWLVYHTEDYPDARIWHFTRDPRYCVTSLQKFGFLNMNHPLMHPHLTRTGNEIVDLWRFWVQWNARICEVPEPRRITFRIEDLSRDLLGRLAESIGASVDLEKVEPHWNEAQAPTECPEALLTEVKPWMERFGYA